MGCTASKSTATVVVPMPEKSKENIKPKRSLKDKEESDSLRGSQSSVRSCSTASRSDREASAQSTRTADSGVGELEDDNIINEHSAQDEIINAKVNERPSTPDLNINGTPLKRRKSPKERLMEDLNNNNKKLSSSLPPMGIIERPQSRGGMAFNVMVYPETGNVKRKPMKLMELEKKQRQSKRKRRTKQEIEHKIKQASDRKKEHDNQVIEKATLSHKEKQLREAKALDEFAKRLEEQES